MSSRKAALSLAFLLFAGCAGTSKLKVGKTDQGEVVEAEGLAPADGGDLIKVKRASLLDAQRNAVEKAVGVFVSGKTFVEQAIAIENNILAKTDGYIKKYDILSEKTEQGFYKTKIRALVALKDLEQDLRENALLKTSDLKKPRIYITLEDNTVETSLAKVLSEQGYVVVEESRKKEAEVVIEGKSSVFPFQATGLGGFVSYRARLNLKAIRPGTKEVIISLSKEASGLGGNNELASLKALETAGEISGQELASELAKAASKAKTVLIFAEGVKSFDDVDRIRKHLQSQPGVADLVLRLYEESMAQFDILLDKSGDPSELAVHLEKSKTVSLKVLEANNQTIRLKLE